MRAVALGDPQVQKKIAAAFIPLKVAIKPGTKALPITWPAVGKWRFTYRLMGGENCDGFTCCTTVSPDLQTEYGNTGSAMVWEMFDSIAYNASKFSAMLDRSTKRFQQEQAIRSNKQLSEEERDKQLTTFRRETRTAIGQEGRFHLPPRGFTIEGAKDLFRMTGDLKD